MIMPMPGFAIVEPLKPETTTKNGVYTGKEDVIAPTEGKILSISYKRETKESDKTLVPGRTVIYRAFAGQLDTKEGMLILPISEIWGVRT